MSYLRLEVPDPIVERVVDELALGVWNGIPDPLRTFRRPERAPARVDFYITSTHIPGPSWAKGPFPWDR